jgi:hypothetical protein
MGLGSFFFQFLNGLGDSFSHEVHELNYRYPHFGGPNSECFVSFLGSVNAFNFLGVHILSWMRYFDFAISYLKSQVNLQNFTKQA